jgi:Glyoxalase superfamily protein
VRDFRDAKAMARVLRDALKAKAVEITHSESLEMIAKAFGCANWNILSARIDAAESRAVSPAARQNNTNRPCDRLSDAGSERHSRRRPAIHVLL